MKKTSYEKASLIYEIHMLQKEQFEKGRFQFVPDIEDLKKLTLKELKDLKRLVIANSI